MSFEALSCKGGASISICTSRALILRVLVWHLLGSTTTIMLPCILTSCGGTRLLIDSHIWILSLQLKKLRRHNKSAIDLSNANPGRGHQQVRHSTRHINGENPLLNPTGIQFVTKSMLGTTNEEHRKLISVETMSLFGYGARFVLLGCCKYFRIGITSYSIVYLSRWRSGEALRRDFLYTTKLESKFILTSFRSIPPPDL